MSAKPPVQTDVAVSSLVQHFAALPDPRVARTQRHLLSDILVISICAIISGADGWTHVEKWARSKEDWLKSFLDLPGGIPSHDTIGRVFAALDPVAFQACFASWAQGLSEEVHVHIAVDGKTLRRSFDRAAGRAAIHVVSAWARDAQLVLAQVKTEEKSNEITAIPILLEMLDLAGSVVTIDAMGCQKDIAERIIQRDGNYVLALKANQPSTLSAVEAAFESEAGATLQFADAARAHGRGEVRRHTNIAVPSDTPELEQWPGLKSLLLVERARIMGDDISVERSYYLSSLAPEVNRHAEIVRGHWGIENELHWCLDVQFNEDQCRVRKDHAPANFATLRHIALNLLKQEKTAKIGLKAKRLMAGWDHAYLLRILGL